MLHLCYKCYMSCFMLYVYLLDRKILRCMNKLGLGPAGSCIGLLSLDPEVLLATELKEELVVEA
jgi:hypothetical protein